MLFLGIVFRGTITWQRIVTLKDDPHYVSLNDLAYTKDRLLLMSEDDEFKSIISKDKIKDGRY